VRAFNVAHSFVVVTIGLALTACSSGVPQAFVPEMGAATLQDQNLAKVAVKITIGTESPANLRRAHYFSRGSAGLLIQVYPHDKNKRIAQAVVDISPGSKACGKSTKFPRMCSATLMLSPSKGDDFLIYDYNVKPAGGKIPPSAHVLGYGGLINKKISAKSNTFVAYLGGVVTGLSGNPNRIVLPGDAAAHSVALVIDPTDFGNNPVTAGKRDPFANPINVSVAETPVSGHASVSLNGGAGAGRVTLFHSTDTVSLEYDGGGAIGYGITVTIQAPTVNGLGGASETILIDPLLLGSSNTDYTNGHLNLRGNGEILTMNAGELNAPPSTAYSVTPQNCIAVASVMPVSGSGTSASFTVLTRSVAGSGCVLAVSDGTTTLDAAVTNTYFGVLGTPVITQFSIPASASGPEEITVGPDGNLWFAQYGLGAIGREKLPQSTFLANVTEFSVTGVAHPSGIITGPDGNLWFANLDTTTASVGKLTTSGVGSAYDTLPAAAEIANVGVGPDNALWFTQYTAPGAIGRVPTSALGITYFTTALSPGSNPTAIVAGPDGNLWFTEHNGSAVAKITPGGAITEFATPTAASWPWGITVGPDGALWFSECYGGGTGNGAIGRIPSNASSSSQIQEFSAGMTGVNPVDLTTGPDGAIWFTYYWSTLIGRIDPTTHAITEYTYPALSPPKAWGITSAPDGAIWFTEQSGSTDGLGRVHIQSTPAIVRTEAHK
jgi:streptogramin lyase